MLSKAELDIITECEGLSLDSAKEQYEDDPSDKHAAMLLNVALVDWRDGMIGDNTFDRLLQLLRTHLCETHGIDN